MVVLSSYLEASMNIYKNSHVLSWRTLWAKDTVSCQSPMGTGARNPALGRSALSNPRIPALHWLLRGESHIHREK